MAQRNGYMPCLLNLQLLPMPQAHARDHPITHSCAHLSYLPAFSYAQQQNVGLVSCTRCNFIFME